MIPAQPCQTKLRCMAPHPAAGRGSRYAGREHGVYLLEVPFYVRWTGRIVRVDDQTTRRVGFIYAPCRSSDCKYETEYEVVPPPMTEETHLVAAGGS